MSIEIHKQPIQQTPTDKPLESRSSSPKSDRAATKNRASTDFVPDLPSTTSISGRESASTVPLKAAFDPERNGKKLKHTEVKGPLFLNGPNVTDVDQGALGDCWLMGGLASLAHTDPEVLSKAVKETSEGNYKVTFYQRNVLFGQKKVEIPVKNTFANFADPTPNNKAELWVAVIEKAYASWKGGYANIYSGRASSAFEALSGKPARRVSVSFFTSTKKVEATIRDAIKNDHPIAVGTVDSGAHSSLIGDHTYSVLGIHERDGKTYVKLYNPHGPNDSNINRMIDVQIDKLRDGICSIYISGS